MDRTRNWRHAYQPLATRVAYLICGASADAEDAAQDGFVKAYRALDRHRRRRAVPAVVAEHRRERGEEPAPISGPPGRLRARTGRGPRPGWGGPLARGCGPRARVAAHAVDRRRRAPGTPARRRVVPLPRRTVRSGDRRSARTSGRDGEVARRPCADATAREARRRCVTTSCRAALADLGGRLDYPYTADLSGAVISRLRSDEPRRLRLPVRAIAITVSGARRCTVGVAGASPRRGRVARDLDRAHRPRRFSTRERRHREPRHHLAARARGAARRGSPGRAVHGAGAGPARPSGDDVRRRASQRAP